MPWLYRVASYVFPPLFGRRTRWTGTEHVPDTGFVIAANHISSIDPFILGLPLWPERCIRYMAKAELFNRWLGWAMRAIGTFPVRRGESDPGAFRTAVELLRSGEVVGMFPEGTRAKKGLRKKFASEPHTGTVRIALAAGVPVIPAAISGTDRLLSRDPIRIAIGPAVRLDDLDGMPRRRAAEIATTRLMEAIETLAAGLRESQPAAAAAERPPHPNG